MRALISILSYRPESGVSECLRSIVSAGIGTAHLYLVANGPASASELRSFRDMHPALVDQLVLNDKNEGFIEPNNRACRHAIEKGYDTLILLNDDTRVPRGWLSQIEAQFERNPAAAIVGAAHTCRTLGESCHGYEGERVEYIDGSCCAVKLAVIQKHFGGRLFPSWLEFCYGEDATLSLLVRRLGYTIHQAPALVIDHRRGSTSARVPRAHEAQAKNHVEMRRRFAHYLKHRTFQHRIVVRRMASLGDVVLTTPVIRALWNENPLCEIVVETKFPEVFAGNPCVAYAAPQIVPRPDDMLINLDMVSENSPMRHFVTSYARAAGIDIDRPFKTEVFWRDEHEPTNLSGLRSGRACAMHVGPTTWRSKNWPMERFEEVSKRLRDDGWVIYLVGADPTRSSIGKWVATPTMNHLAAFLSSCQLFIGLDSGPMHVAQAVGVSTVGIFGITESRYILTDGSPAIGVDADPKVAPRAGERHRVVGVNHVEEDGTTIRTISVDAVMNAVDRLTKANVPTTR